SRTFSPGRIAAAERAAPGGRVTGLDISETLLAIARHRAGGRPNVAFLEADAQTHRFDPASQDAILSRHGLMFFADPLAAFRNLAVALRPGGRIVFLAWADARLNPWVREARAAAEARLGPVPPDPPRTPGMFAFTDRDHVAGLLAAAGFTGIAAEALRTELHLEGTAGDAAALAAAIGPVNYVVRVRGGTESDRVAIAADLATRFRRFETPQGMRVPAVMNLFAARRS
ncbi:MAG: class I SAM-dependent methyltransferase, partial [Albidovulum sp.]|uniref:class I SAM-dependent methyltransferase n=1 Tax=Albidovulum sp. TaxID=1872424 RepID=UPI0013268CDA